MQAQGIFHFLAVRFEDRWILVFEKIIVLRIDKNRNRFTLSKSRYAANEFRRKHPFIIIFENDRIEVFTMRIYIRKYFILGFGIEIMFALMIDAKHLLACGDNSCFDRRRTVRIG